MTNSWSYSAYSTAVQCLRKYQYVYVDKLAPEGPESCDLIFGSAVHSAINSSLTEGNGPATFDVYWNSYKEKEIEYGRFKWEDLAQIGAKFIRNFDKFHARKYKLEFAEQRLYAQYRGVNLEGTLDFYGEYDGKRCLRDFKTSSRNYDGGKEQCALQLYLYVYLLHSNGRTLPETLGYTVFNKGTGYIQDLTWEFSEKKMYLALDDLVDYCQSINQRDAYEAKPTYPRNLNACLDYNRQCPYWDKCHKENKVDE